MQYRFTIRLLKIRGVKEHETQYCEDQSCHSGSAFLKKADVSYISGHREPGKWS